MERQRVRDRGPVELQTHRHPASYRFAALLPLAALCMALVGCGGDDDDGGGGGNPTATTGRATATPTTEASPAATATRTATLSSTPVSGSRVSGLVVVNRNVTARVDDALGAPPAEWINDASNVRFDRALGYADWTVAENQNVRGTTGPDGQFEIAGLAPGHYTVSFGKTVNGNLLSVPVPIAVGPDGSTVVAEVSWGQARSVSTYEEGGVEVREVRDPYGRRLITRDGHISELGDGSVTISDPDGDGQFDVEPCVDTLWLCQSGDSCGEGRSCGCVGACPGCEDCGAMACQPPGLNPSPYRCDENGGCDDPSHRCVCVSGCPDCDDCTVRACVAGCSGVEITTLTVSVFPAPLVLGQTGNAQAIATLSNDRGIDVTTLVNWQSSDEGVATVDSFGVVTTSSVGTTGITAELGEVTSPPFDLVVQERPPLRNIYVQNVNCYYPLGVPVDQPSTKPPVLEAPARDDIWWPVCNQVIQIGGTITFSALGEFGTGASPGNSTYYQDITGEVTWQLDPSNIGEIVAGVFTAEAAGTAQLTASLGAVVSDVNEIRVVTEPTVVTLSIYPEYGGFFTDLPRPVPGTANGGVAIDPCFECGYTVTVLLGDELKFHATAHYDTGEWRDVTDSVTWRSGDTSVATIDASGTMMAIAAGTAVIDASFEEVTSNEVTVRSVTEATLQYLYMYQEGDQDHAVIQGGQLFFRASGSYDLGFQRDVTLDATWHSSDEAVGGFDTPGIFTGRGAGTTRVWAEVGSLRTEPLDLQVYVTSDITYCDPNDVNRGVWSDDFNRVVLESDCAEYTQPDVVTLRYTVTESQRPGGIFDPCLDLYVYDGPTKIRTLREEGCGEPFLPREAPAFDAALPRFQLSAFWDLKDETGQPVAPGTYTVFGRFYLYYDPVVTIDVTVN